jgi:hypothetical protein
MAGERVFPGDSFTGKMTRIRAGGTKAVGSKVEGGTRRAVVKRTYDLQMDPGQLHFQFTEDRRKQLAKLKVGQELTIEGKLTHIVCAEDYGAGSLVFEECKIVRPRAED